MTDRQTEFTSLDRVCIACSAVKTIAESLDAHFRIFGGRAKGGNRIVMKFSLEVGVPDVITHANLGDNRFGGF